MPSNGLERIVDQLSAYPRIKRISLSLNFNLTVGQSAEKSGVLLQDCMFLSKVFILFFRSKKESQKSRFSIFSFCNKSTSKIFKILIDHEPAGVGVPPSIPFVAMPGPEPAGRYHPSHHPCPCGLIGPKQSNAMVVLKMASTAGPLEQVSPLMSDRMALPNHALCSACRFLSPLRGGGHVFQNLFGLPLRDAPRRALRRVLAPFFRCP